jgi:hypothetical protein
MALIRIDSFDHFDTTSGLEQKNWAHSGVDIAVAVTEGRRGGGCLNGAGGVGNFYTLSLDNEVTDPLFVIGTATRLTSSTQADNVYRLRGPANESIARLYVTASGAVGLENYVTTTTAVSADGVVDLNTYAYIEMVYFKDNTTGYIQGWKDGVKVVEITAEDTDNSVNVANIFMDKVAGGRQYQDDLYCLDGTGTTNNARLGDVRVDVHYPDADGTTTDFIPFVAGSNFEMVDEQYVDDDTTFIEAGTINAQEYHTVPDPTLGTVIYGVQHVVSHRKTDAGTVTLNLKSNKPAGSGVKIHTQDTSGDNYAMTTAIFDTDPDDSATWSDSRIGATEWGFSIVDITT